MDQLFRLKDTVIEYLSPKRRRTIGPSTPSRHEECVFEATSEPQGQKAQNALRSRIRASYPSPPDTRFGPGSRKRAREDEDDINGAGSQITSSDITPDESASQVTPVGGSENESGVGLVEEDEVEEGDGELEEDLEEDLEEEQVSSEDKVAEYLARQAELEVRKEAIAEVKAKGDWHPDEIFFFERLSMRSFEVIFPAEWKIDFPTLAGELFHTEGKDTFINYNYSSSAAGYKALQRLFDLGGRVKDKAALGLHTERFIGAEIQKYIQWSERDGGYSNLRFIPILTKVVARPRESIDSISKSITDQMDFLAEKHRENLLLANPLVNEDGETELYSRQPPLLYGMIVAQTKVVFVTLDSANPEAKLRHIAHVDLKEEGHHVWNGLAIAIIAIMARNSIMSIKDDLEEEDEDISSDPDA